jgi:poly(glycerol-phosphate) alpha-glucosyltransferase
MDAYRPDLAGHTPVHFPDGRQFALTWSIPDDFGGMTSALLHRSRGFVRLAGKPVDILTFDARTDYPALEQQLRDRSELIDGLGLINIWDWFRENDIAEDAPGSVDLERHEFTPLAADPAFVSGWRGDHELTRARADGDTTLQVDYYREDGSLLASDRRDTANGRAIVLCDRTGTPIRSWSGAWAFYRFWLDVIRQRQPSFMIVDSKTVANFMATYRRKRAVIVHVVHGTHLAGGTLSASRRATFENLGAWDSVVLLTQRQRADVEALLGVHRNLAVIGNGRDIESAAESRDREVGKGIMLASLTARKRVDHAVRAVARAAAEHPGVSLDVYGDGPERERVAGAIAELDAPVRLRGHVPDAKELLGDSSFLLLTSSSEGLPLVLVEAMSAGCIPIAYDIPYGPADVIRHGRNGYLVPAGDPDAPAHAIAELQSLTPRQVARLRRHARRSAQEFSDLAITRLWNHELRAAASRKAAAWAAERRQATDRRERVG